jgi:hypothetical protein
MISSTNIDMIIYMYYFYILVHNLQTLTLTIAKYIKVSDGVDNE